MRLLQTMAGAAVGGGAEAFFVRLACALTAAGLAQRAVIRRHAARAAALRAAGVETVELGFGGPFDRATRPAVARAIAAFDPDIVVCWMNRAARATPTSAGRRYALAGRLGGYYDLKYYRHCDHLVANTPAVRDHVVRGDWPADRVHCLPNFVHPPRRPPADRGALDTPDDAPVLLALGRLHPNKAFDVLLRALVALPEAWLWIAGDGPLRARLEALAGELGLAGRTRFLGWRDDGDALLAAADILVCPSRHEPLGNVVLEAWAAARPVVAARSDGPAGLVRDGVDGRLVAVDDVAALAGALAETLGDRAASRRLAAAGRARYEQDYTEAAVVAQYLDFFRRISRR